HQTEYVLQESACTFTRALDSDHYYCALAWKGHGEFSQTSAHQFRLAAPGSEVLEFTIAFAPAPMDAVPEAALPSFEETQAAAAAHWSQFWESGGAVDLN